MFTILLIVVVVVAVSAMRLCKDALSDGFTRWVDIPASSSNIVIEFYVTLKLCSFILFRTSFLLVCVSSWIQLIPNHDDVTCRLLEALRDGGGSDRVGQYVKFQRKLDERFLRGRSSRHGVIASPVQRAAAGRAAGCTSRFAVFVQCRNNDYCALVMACACEHGRDMMMVVIAR